MVPDFTVLGADGFLGRALLAGLKRLGHRAHGIGRRGALPSGPLGHVMYAVGVTHDFRARPLDLADAHVGLVARVLQSGQASGLTYLSSLRPALRRHVGEGGSGFLVDPEDADQTYDLSKLCGESLCLASGHPQVRVVRLADVVGPGSGSGGFLPSVVEDALQGHIRLRTHPDSTRDFLDVRDAAELLIAVALRGRRSVYELGSGQLTTHREVCDHLSALTGCTWDAEESAPRVSRGAVDLTRLAIEFGFQPRTPLAVLPLVLREAARRGTGQLQENRVHP